MPGCCVKNCTNSVAKGFRLFRLPSGETNTFKKQEWLNLFGRPYLPLSARICESHFSNSQMEASRQGGRKLLRCNAIPDILEQNLNDETYNVKRKPTFDKDMPEPKKLVVSKKDDGSELKKLETRSIVHENVDVLNETSDRSINNGQDEIEEWDMLETMERSTKDMDSLVADLKQKLKASLQKCHRLETKLQQKGSNNLGNIFNADQLKYLETYSSRGSPWFDDTITKALKLYIACGTKGYEEICRQKLPYPSIRTLQHRLRNMKFRPGILHEVFEVLKLKMEQFQPEEKDAIPIFDEMAIKLGLQYNNTLSEIIGHPTLKSSHDGDNAFATHALVYMLAGVTTRWKQIIVHDFRANSCHPNECFNRIMEIIEKSFNMGITIRVAISDMGGQNCVLWKLLYIMAGKYSKILNFVKHPCMTEAKLFFMPDPVHVYKNVAASLTQGNIFILSDIVVQENKLSSNEVSIVPIKELYNIDKNDTIKLCPRLKHNVIYPSHFNKMNVGLSVALLSND